MTRRRAPAAALVVSAILGPLATVSAAAADCTGADALRAAGQLEPARKAYLRLLDAPDAPACSRAGFDATADAQRRARVELQRGRDLAAVKDGGALAAYVRALSLDNSLTEAVEAIVALSNPPVQPSEGSPFELAVAFQRSGYEDAAKAEVQRVLKESRPTVAQINELPALGLAGPGIDPLQKARALYAAGYRDEAKAETKKVLAQTTRPLEVPEDLEGDAGKALNRLLEWAQDALKWLAAIFVLGTILFAIVVALLRLVPLRSKKLRFLRRVREGWPVLKSVFTPQLAIGDIEAPDDPPVGPTVAAMLRQEIAESQPTRAGSLTKHVTTAEAGADVANLLAEVPTQMRLPLRVLMTVTRRERFLVTGQVHVSALDEAALSLDITDRTGAVRASYTFTGPRPKPAPQDGEEGEESAAKLDPRPWLELVPRAGAWLVYVLHDDVWPPADLAPLTLLGTSQVHSYGRFRVGLYRQRLGDRRGASAAYREALSYDSGNYGALINRGSLAFSSGGPGASTLTVDSMESALKAMGDGEPASSGAASEQCRNNPHWYRAMYFLAAARAHRASATRPGPQPSAVAPQIPPGATGNGATGDGSRAVADASEDPDLAADPVADRAQAKAVAIRLVQGIGHVLSEGKTETSDERRLLELVRNAEQWSVPVLASLLIGQGGASTESVAHLAADERKRGERLRQIIQKPLSAANLILLFTPTSSEGYYNAACYYAAAGNPDEALEQLRRSLEIVPRAEQALYDPLFANLRTDPVKERFEKLLARYRPPKAAPPELSAPGGILWRVTRGA